MDFGLSLFQAATAVASPSSHPPPSTSSTSSSADTAAHPHSHPPNPLSPTTTSNFFLSLLFFNATTSFSTVALLNDPNKLKNFQFLRKAFENVYSTMVRDKARSHFVILCPTNDALVGKNSLSGIEWEWGGMDEDFLTSHIVRVPDRTHAEARTKFTTLNGKSLIVSSDLTITTAKGFKALKQVRIVGERLFYGNDGQGWIVLFIDRPLVGMSEAEAAAAAAAAMSGSGTASPTSPRPSVQSLSSPIMFKPSTPTPVTGFPPPSSIPTASPSGSATATTSTTLLSTDAQIQQQSNLRRTTRQLTILQVPKKYPFQSRGSTQQQSTTRAPLTLPVALQRFPGVGAKIEKLIVDFNDATMALDKLVEIRSAVEQLILKSVDILNQVNSAALMSLLKEYDLELGSLDQILESYIMNSTYDIIFFKVTLHQRNKDWELSEAIRELQNLDLAQVGLPDTEHHHRCLVSALNEFQAIGVLRTPEEKLTCLVKTIRVATTLSGGADDLIPILLLTVLRSNFSNLASNLYYMKNFIVFEDASRGEYGYSLSTLEAVSEYILEQVAKLGPVSKQNQEYWDLIEVGDLDGVKKVHQEAAKRIQSTSVVQDAKGSVSPSMALPAQPPPPRRVASTSGGTEVLLTSPATMSIYSRDAEGNNGVILACRAQQFEILKYLVEDQGQSANVANYEGQTLLMHALRAASMEIVRFVLKHLNTGSNCDKSNIAKESPEGTQNRSRSFSSPKPTNPLTCQDLNGNTVVHQCVEIGNIELLTTILGAENELKTKAAAATMGMTKSTRSVLEIANHDGDTPLILACKLVDRDERYFQIIEILLNRMKTQATILNRQVTSEQLQVIEDVNAQNNRGDTALHFLGNHTKLMELLIKQYGAHPDLENYQGITPLLKWTLEGNVEAVRFLALVAGTTTTIPISSSSTAAAGAITSTDNKSIPSPQYHIDFLMTDARGFCPLHIACLNGNLELVKVLSNRLAIDIHSLIDGSTPLQLACQAGAEDVVEFLLDMGANPELRNWLGESAADMTADEKLLDMMDDAMLFWDSQKSVLRLTEKMIKKEKGPGGLVSTSVSSGSLTTTPPAKAPSTAAATITTTSGTTTTTTTTSTFTSSPTSPTTATKESSKRVIRVVRGTMGSEGMQYIVKSGTVSGNQRSVVTMPRSLSDFRLLRQALLLEHPDVCIPLLSNFYSPFLISPSRPSKTVVSVTTRRLDMFLKYLSNHPIFAEHELLWEFMLMPELQMDVILYRSKCKQENAMETIYDDFKPSVEDLDHEETYFGFLKSTIQQLESAVQECRISARKLHRSAGDVPQQLGLLANVVGRLDLVFCSSADSILATASSPSLSLPVVTGGGGGRVSGGVQGIRKVQEERLLLEKERDHQQQEHERVQQCYVEAIRAFESTQEKMYRSDIESLGNLFEDFCSVIEGTLFALKQPDEIMDRIRELTRAKNKMERQLQLQQQQLLLQQQQHGSGTRDHWWSGFNNTITGGANIVIGGAGAVLGAATNAAISTVGSPFLAPMNPFSAPTSHQGSTNNSSGNNSPGLGASPRTASVGGGGESEKGVERERGGLVGGIGSTFRKQHERARTASTSSSYLTSVIQPNSTAASLAAAAAVGDATLEKGGKRTGGGRTHLRQLSFNPLLPQGQRHEQQSSLSSLSLSLSSSPTPIPTPPIPTTLEEIKAQLGRASCLLNHTHGSLADELAHLQNHHTKELTRTMQEYGARQLQIEKSRLRDMVEILESVKVQVGGVWMGGKDVYGRSRHSEDDRHGSSESEESNNDGDDDDDSEYRQGDRSSRRRRRRREGSFNGSGVLRRQGSVGSGLVIMMDEEDEKKEMRKRQQQRQRYEKANRKSLRQESMKRSGDEDQASSSRQGTTDGSRNQPHEDEDDDGDALSEKVPF